MNSGTRRLWPCLAALAALAAVVVPAASAAAHGGGQTIPDAAYYRSSLTGVAPSPDGISVRVDPAGEFIELTNTGAAVVVVLGYSGEPYLRVAATGLAEPDSASGTQRVPEWVLWLAESMAVVIGLLVLQLVRQRHHMKTKAQPPTDEPAPTEAPPNAASMVDLRL